MTSIYDVLKASKGIHVDDTFAELWGRKLSNAYTVETYIGTLPATLQTVEGYLESYKIYGNTVQDGTPTPENPITPSGCGERTENLFDASRLPSDTWTTDTRYYINGGIITSKTVMPATVTISLNNDTLSVSTTGGRGAGFLVEVKPSTKYRLVFTKSESLASDITSCLYAFVDTSETIGQAQAIYGDADNVVFTTNSNTKYVYFVFRKALGTISYSNIMFSEGQTPFPYEPYGYKLPLLSGSTPVDIYLGESQTTRRIKKLVLTGEEGWQRTANKRCYYINSATGCPTDYLKSNIITVICSHYVSQTNTKSGSNEVNEGCVCFFIGGGYEMYIGETTITSAADFKAYLAQQYANGTPVTVWYVLAEPETVVLNEPLMKIDNYADTVSMEQAGVSIPTFAGTTVIDYNGTPKPDKVELTYRKPKGQ